MRPVPHVAAHAGPPEPGVRPSLARRSSGRRLAVRMAVSAAAVGVGWFLLGASPASASEGPSRGALSAVDSLVGDVVPVVEALAAPVVPVQAPVAPVMPAPVAPVLPAPVLPAPAPVLRSPIPAPPAIVAAPPAGAPGQASVPTPSVPGADTVPAATAASVFNALSRATRAVESVLTSVDAVDALDVDALVDAVPVVDATVSVDSLLRVHVRVDAAAPLDAIDGSRPDGAADPQASDAVPARISAPPVACIAESLSSEAASAPARSLAPRAAAVAAGTAAHSDMPAVVATPHPGQADGPGDDRHAPATTPSSASGSTTTSAGHAALDGEVRFVLQVSGRSSLDTRSITDPLSNDPGSFPD